MNKASSKFRMAVHGGVAFRHAISFAYNLFNKGSKNREQVKRKLFFNYKLITILLFFSSLY